jgi:PAS domain S-box-containing protein
MPSLGVNPEVSPQVLRSALDVTRLLILMVDARGVVQATNRAVQRATSLSEEALRRPIWELAALSEERALLQSAFSPLKPDALPPSVLFHLISSGTSARVVDWDIQIVQEGGGGDGGGGDVSAVVFGGIDLSDRLAAEQHLRESEAIQRLILDRLPAVVWATDRDLRFTFSAGGGLSSLGLGSGQVALLGTSLYGYFQTRDAAHPGIAPHVQALRGEPVAVEISWLDRVFQTRVEPLRDRQENIVGCIGLALDVTEQSKTAEALKTSEARLRRLVESNVIGIVFWDETGRVTEANQAFLQLLGLTRDELLSGKVSWKDLTPPEFQLLDERSLAELRTVGRCTPFEKEYVAKDGTRVPILVGGARFNGSHEGPLEGIAFILDMRDQVRLRATRDRLLLDEQSARIETEVANARLLLLVEASRRLSRTMNITDSLEKLAALVVPGLADWTYVVHKGWDGGRALVACAHGDPNKVELLRRLESCMPDPMAPEGAPRVFRTGELVHYADITTDQLTPSSLAWPIVGTRDPGHLHTLRELGMKSLMCVPIQGRSGVDAVIMLVSATDPRRYDQDDVVLARELANRAAVTLENGRLLSEAQEAIRARDDFLAVAAHELRTPLTSLLLQIEMLGRAIERDRLVVGAARRVAAVETQARRLSVLVDGLLDVARLTTHQLFIRIEELDLRQLVNGLMATMAADFQRAGCAVSVTMPGEVLGRWDRVRTEQVLTNLLSNAMKFGARRPIEMNVEATDTNVRISVRDHGIGISREDQARIFGRFERAVPTRHFGGLGLGLYISVQILRAQQGSLRVESEPGQGACFIVDLPRNLERSLMTADASPPSMP